MHIMANTFTPAPGANIPLTQTRDQGKAVITGEAAVALNKGSRLGKTGGRRAARMFFNRHSVLANNASGRTHHMVVELPAQFDQIMVVAINNQAAQVVELQATVCVMANLNDINNSSTSGGWSNLLNWSVNNGNSSVARVPVSPGQISGRDRKSYIVSEPVTISSLPKTDGQKGAYLGIRYFMRTDIPNYTVLGNGTTDLLSQWASRPSTKGTMILRSQVGQFVLNSSSVASFTSTTNENTTPIAGIIALYRNRVVGVVRAGDSIADGRGTPHGEGYGWIACDSASDGDITFVDTNLGAAGQPGVVYQQDLKDLLTSPVGKYIDAIVYHSGSPNDINTVITDADIAGMRLRLNDTIDVADRSGKVVIPVTWGPTNNALKSYGETDSLRVAYNNYVKSLPLPYVDLDGVIAGATVGGQVQIRVDYTDDNIHPNNAGNAAIAALMVPQLKLLK